MRFTQLYLCSGTLLFVLARLSSAQDLPVMDGLQLWLDATDASTVFQAPFFQDPASDGDFVESWKDKSSNGFEVYVADGAGAPTYETDAINGLPAVRFFGSSADGMIIDGLEVERPYTAFIVNQYWGDIRGRTLQSQNINWLLGLWAGNYGHYAEGWVSPQPPAEVNRPYVADAIGTEDESFFYINGVDWTTNSSPVGVPGALAIGGAGQFPGEVSDADVSEVIIYDRILSDVELESMRSHLYTKYGTVMVDPPPPPAELVVHAGTIGTFANASDLDFSGDFAYAVNVGGPADNLDFDPVVIGDATFLDGTNGAELDLEDDGVTITVANEIINWHAPDYGDSLDDDNLEFVMQSIRWNVPPGVEVDLDVEAGKSYKLQMLFAESCCDRGFDIFMDGEEVVTDLVVQQQQGGINNQQTGVVYSREFVAGDDQLNILLGGSVLVPDNNPILNGFTLERIEDIIVEPTCNPNTQGDVNGDGAVDFADFLVLSANFGNPVSDHTGGDIDCDGTVGFSDFLVLSANFGTTVGQASSQAVPEPSAFGLAGLAVFGVGCFRRRRR